MVLPYTGPGRTPAERAAWAAAQAREREQLLAAVAQPVHLHFFGLEEGDGSDVDDADDAGGAGAPSAPGAGACW